jgi:integrase
VLAGGQARITDIPSTSRAEPPANRSYRPARSKPERIFAHVASTLAFYGGLRAREIRGLQWKHVDWDNTRSNSALEDVGWPARPESERCLRTGCVY